MPMFILSGYSCQWSTILKPNPIAMKITLDAHNLHVAGGLSVGKNIVQILPVIAPMHEYLIIVPKDCGYPQFTGHSNAELIYCPRMSFQKRFFWEKNVLRKKIKDFASDWIWALGNIAVGYPGCPQSLLLHNPHRVYPVSLTNPFLYERALKIGSNFLLKRSLKHLDRVYCQTETMAGRFSAQYGFPREKIHLCPNAFSSSIVPGYKIPHKLVPFQGKFTLFVLTKYYTHKNLERIAEMYEKFHDELHDVVCIIPLAEDQGPKAAQLIHRIKKHHLEQNIVCTGIIQQEELGDYFFASDAMFLPTLLESFSGTYLEAMTLETPVLTSDLDFAREICGNAAEYIDPYSIESMKNGILKLKSSPERCQELVGLGKARAKSSLKNWNQIITTVLDVENIPYTSIL